MAESIYNAKKLTAELQAAKLPVSGVSSSGRINYSRELTSIEKSTAEAVLASHDPSPDEKQMEKELFASKGITDHDLLMALWKKVVNADSMEADALAELINAV